MATARFILKEPNSKEETLIFLLFSFGNCRLKYSTGEKINPKYWNPKKQRVKETAQFSEYPEFNARLNNIEAAIRNAYRKLLNDGQAPEPETLKKELNFTLRPNRGTTDNGFWPFIENFISSSKHTRKLSTVQVYEATAKVLKDYCVEKRLRLDFDVITLDFYNSFIAYLSKDRNLANNTIGKYIKTLITFLNEATERGINKNLEYKSRKFKRLIEEVDHVYLNHHELAIMEILDLSEKPYLEKTRDLFLVGCYTGLRYSDFTQVKPSNITMHDGQRFIEIRTVKTNEKVVIPVKPVVEGIIQKYGNDLPRIISNQKMNEYLKIICKMAGINSLVEIKRTSGNRVTSETLPKWQLITTHTARRSFATNAYKMKVPAIAIMKITGHRTEAAFLKYIKVNKEENAIILSDHPFFN